MEIFSILFSLTGILTGISSAVYSLIKKKQLKEESQAFIKSKNSSISQINTTLPEEESISDIPVITRKQLLSIDPLDSSKITTQELHRGKHIGSLVFDVNVIYTGIVNEDLKVSDIDQISNELISNLNKDEELLPNIKRTITINGISVSVEQWNSRRDKKSTKMIDEDKAEFKDPS